MIVRCATKPDLKRPLIPSLFRVTAYTAISLFMSLLMLAGELRCEEKVLRLSVEEAVALALERNLSLNIEQYNTKISETDIMAAKGEFDPYFEIDINEVYGKWLTPTSLQNSQERSYSYDITLSGKFDTGATYDLSFDNERSKAESVFLEINPFYSTEFILTLTQPLLKDFGSSVQNTKIYVAKKNYEKSLLKLDGKAIDTAAEAAKIYWDILEAGSRLEVETLSLSLAMKMHEEIKARIDVGVLAPVEVYNTEAEIAKREEVIIGEEKRVGDMEDRLKSILNLDDWSVRIEIVSSPPGISEIHESDDVITFALKSRQDYQELLLEKENKEALLHFYKNQRLPDLSIYGSYGPNGLDRNYTDALDEMLSGDNYYWKMGVIFKSKLGNREGNADYYRAKYEIEQLTASINDLRNNVTIEVREALRAIGHAEKNIKATKKTRYAAKKRLEAEEGRFNVGLTTSNDVLKFQNEFADALFQEKKAEIDYARARIELNRVQGKLP